MSSIERWGDTRRWSDVVVHNGLAYWVEVAEDFDEDLRGQVQQVLSQIDATLTRLGSDRTHLLQVLIYVADLGHARILNDVWDAWVPAGHAPVRACVQAGLAMGCEVEMVIIAAAQQRRDVPGAAGS